MADKNIPPYLNENLSFEERAADLVSRMTLEEKAAQLKNEAAAIPRLGVEAYNYWREGLHGVARQGKATSFPTSLAMANTWNRDLVFRAAEITSTEARGKNPRTNLSYWSPTVNMARDPRWGRNEETYGEDPYLTGQLGIEFVKGFQGDDEKYLKIIATVKHFIANNVEKERRMGTSVMSEQTLRDYYARVFQNIVEASDPASAMSSYNATTIYRDGEQLYDYVPATANPYVLKDLLRRNWGFNGYVTGDCGAFGDLNATAAYKTELFPDKDINDVPQSATITKGFLNGADTDCGIAAAAGSVLEAVENGDITEDDLNINLYNLFLQRMRTGEFDKNPIYRDITPDVLEKPEHIAVAEEAAEQSWVLLKNEGILPLDKSIKKVALVGALADEVVLGDYSGSPEFPVTPYEGITAELKRTNPEAELEYLGGVTDNTKLMNIHSIALVLRSGETRTIELENAESVSGMALQNGAFSDVTRKSTALIKQIDFSGVVSVKANIEAIAGGKMKLYYGFGGPQVAELRTAASGGVAECSGEYTGEAGGYCRTEDLYIEFEANAGKFSVDKYRAELDAADVIIAYAGTTLSDSAEFNDRSNIDLPKSQSHVPALTEAYPEKTVVVLQTVGQIDVAPFEKGAKAMLWTSYNGQTQGTAIGKILTGQANPSGKLTTTWYTVEDLEKMPVGVPGVKGEDGIVRYYNNYEIKPGENFPGRTYQYYRNNPVYPFGYGLSYTKFEYSNFRISSDKVTAADKITVKVDVTNAGDVFGMETVQFYVGYPESDLPKVQLKGFDKLALNPGETKTATAVIMISELRFFDEKAQKVYVPLGEYKIYASKNSAELNLQAEFTVTEGIKPALKNVAALPSGIIVRGLVGEDVETVTSVSANLSAILNDESYIELDNSNTTYSSADENIARVNADGTVLPRTKEGVTTITAAVTYEGVTKYAKFPVVNVPEYKATSADKEEAESKLKAERKNCFAEAYSENGINQLDMALTEGLNAIKLAVKREALDGALAQAIANLRRVEPDNLKMRYNIIAPELQNGVIEKGGMIKMTAVDNNGNEIQAKWQLENHFDSASIDENTGELSVSEHGLIKVRAINIGELSRGEAVIYTNLPIQGESAYNGNGADLTAKDESGNGYAANTKSRALEYKGIRLENLKQIMLRYSLPELKAVARFTSSGITIAEGVMESTGGETNWNDIIIDVDAALLYKCEADENGLSTIRLVANDANIDCFKLIYEDVDNENPYRIAAVESGEDGSVIAYVNYVGTGAPEKAELVCGDKTVTVCGGGVYNIAADAKEGETLELSLCGVTNSHTYTEPKPKRRVVYRAGEPAYAALFDKSGAVKLPEINGLTGYGPLKRHGNAEIDWQGGDGSESRACLFFVPEAPCDVTVIYDGGEHREQYIVQNGIRLASGLSSPKEKTAITARITDTTVPVYTYGGGSNKSVYEIIVDYIGGEDKPVRTVQSIITSSGFARLDSDGRVYLSDTGRVWSRVDMSVFEIDKPTVNGLAVHKDRLYAACDAGEVLIITDCPKCRTHKKLCDFDIKDIEITDDTMILSGGAERKEISMTALGADQIKIDEAMQLIANGAVAIDVREEEVFKSEPTKIEGSINIPLPELEKISTYSRDTKIIFCCSHGIWSAEAVLRAKEMGYENVYYLI